MNIQVSVDSGTPIYVQIHRQIQHLVSSRRLRPGEELPSIRSLAAQLVINPNTVARAYRELESAGVVTKRGTSGTFVADDASELSMRRRRETLCRRVEELLESVHEMGFSTDDLIETIHLCDTYADQPGSGKT